MKYRKHMAFALILTISPLCLAKSSLNDLRWQQRILLVYGTQPVDLEAWQAALSYHDAALRERKLWVWVNTSGNPVRYPDSDSQRHITLDWSEYAPGFAHLIGLDGGIKATYPLAQFSFDAVFGDIDQMPMRRQELKR